MGKIYNRQSDKEKRKKLRRNMTKVETFLWLEIKDRKILGCKFRRQFRIGIYVVDFYCPEVKLAIEADGATHCTDDEIVYDKLRQGTIENLGITFLRFTNIEIYEDMFNVLEKIKANIEELKTRNPHL